MLLRPIFTDQSSFPVFFSLPGETERQKEREELNETERERHGISQRGRGRERGGG